MSCYVPRQASTDGFALSRPLRSWPLVALVAPILALAAGTQGETASPASVERFDALSLAQGGHAEMPTPPELKASEGSLSFRVKPLWRPEDRASHTFVSMRWLDARNGYLAISQGWWEPLGAERLYFILNNEDFVHCSARLRLDSESWSTITAVWKSGRDGYCKLFVNGDKIAEAAKAFDGGYAPGPIIYLGSDEGTALRKGRRAEALLAGFAVLGEALIESEVARRYGGEPAAGRQKWLADLLARAPAPRLLRDARGRLRERRVLLDEDIEWATSEAATERILSQVRAAGFNVFIPCVWHGEGSTYPTHLVAPDARIAPRIAAGSDPLAYLLERAHALGIEVHPWFTVVRREGNRMPQYHAEGTPEGAFDVHNAAFRRFIVQLMLDAARRYPVDGINLDYIRSMGVCTSGACREDYGRRFGRSLKVDLALADIPGGKKDTLEAWNAQAVGAIVREISAQARALRPGLVISVDAHPLNRDLLLQGQDSVGWENADWIDAIFNMDYRKRIDVETAQRAVSRLAVPARMTMLLSTFDLVDGRPVARDPALLADYVELARRLWPGSGIAFYHRKQLTDAQANALRESVFAEAAQASWPRP
jgi:uncharacterized lipoprotein YddW (UPF0748 family)